MQTTTPLNGTCACGAVRYRLTPPTDFASHCHCRSCRRVSGAAFLTWTSVPRDRFACDGEAEVRWYRSSETIRWGFCGRCGTTLFYVADREGHAEAPSPDRVYLTVASLDDPLDRKPSAHVSFEERVPWLVSGDHLPKHVGKTEAREAEPGAHLILYVADQAASTAFYAAVLGRPPRLAVPGMTEFELPGNAVLGLMPTAGVTRLFEGTVSTQGTSARAELYLRVTDAAAHHARAVAAGAVELSAMADRDWGERVAYSRDPDGHVLGFAELGQ